LSLLEPSRCLVADAKQTNDAQDGCGAQVIFHVTIQNKSLDFPPTVPEELSGIGARCMKKDPADRPTMKEVVQELEKLDFTPHI
jgi:hypothetical protein